METTTQPIDESLWTVADTARYLRLSTSAVYKKATAGEIPSVHLGAAVRFEPAAIRQYVAERAAASRVSATTHPQPEAA